MRFLGTPDCNENVAVVLEVFGVEHHAGEDVVAEVVDEFHAFHVGLRVLFQELLVSLLELGAAFGSFRVQWLILVDLLENFLREINIRIHFQ